MTKEELEQRRFMEILDPSLKLKRLEEKKRRR
jgi:hypothetical protein